MGLDGALSKKHEDHENKITEILSSPKTEDDAHEQPLHLYTGTSEEDLEEKLDESDDLFRDWEDRKLWFTPYSHNRPDSAIYYASQAMSGGQCRDYEEANTPIVIQWKVPHSEVSRTGIQEPDQDSRLAYNPKSEEYFAYEVPVDWMDGYLRPSGGSRIKQGWEIDPEGWEFVNQDF